MLQSTVPRFIADLQFVAWCLHDRLKNCELSYCFIDFKPSKERKGLKRIVSNAIMHRRLKKREEGRTSVGFITNFLRPENHVLLGTMLFAFNSWF